MLIDRNAKDKNTISSLKETLLSKGSCLIPKENSFLTIDQWTVINYEANKLDYNKVSIGDTNEPLSFWVSRIKTQNNDAIKNKVIFDIINSTQSHQFVSLLTGINNFFIARCQCHIYEEGDFISLHRDKDSCEDYAYVVSSFLEGSYVGGEFIINLPAGEKYIQSPMPGEILITSCDLPHEVKPVISGKRMVLHAFIQPM